MKKLCFLSLLLLAFTVKMAGQPVNNDYISKVQSIDSTIATLYAVISGEKGEERNWELFEYLFHPDAKLIPTQPDTERDYTALYMTPTGYRERAGIWLIENGFFEKEIYKTVNTFGPIAQVFSTYESYKSANDTVPFMRGINSIQLLDDGNRWWVINIYWTQETEENPIPKEYLPSH